MATSALTLIPGGVVSPSLPSAGVEVVSEPLPLRLLSLAQLEEELEALGDTTELVPQDQESEFLKRFEEVYAATANKRDRTHSVMVFLKSQIELAKAEEERQRDRRAMLARHLERMEKYLVWIVKSKGQDQRKKWRTLEGNTVSFSIKKNPDSVLIEDEQLVPNDYKYATLTMPYPLWERLMDAIDIETAAEIGEAIRRPEVTVRKDLVKTALKVELEPQPDGTKVFQQVPGARFADTRHSLVVK